MKQFFLIMAIGLLSGCAHAHGWDRQTGHLLVSMTDRLSGEPITNATVTVRTLNVLGINAGALESHYTTTSATSDTNGVVDVAFDFLSPHFTWSVTTPSHHSSAFGVKDEFFPCEVEPSDYENIETNTVEGLMMFNELKLLHDSGDAEGYAAKFEPKQVSYGATTIRRSVSFCSKRNPQPMYACGNDNNLRLPQEGTPGSEDSDGVVQFPEVGFVLLKEGGLPIECVYDLNSADSWDFKLVRSLVTTNGVQTFCGYLEFQDGCGVARGVKTTDLSAPALFAASTNAVDYVRRLDFFASRDVSTGRLLCSRPLAGENEYLVLRTRYCRSDHENQNHRYSIISGRIKIRSTFGFPSLIINPNPDDPNLECDYSRNLTW